MKGTERHLLVAALLLATVAMITIPSVSTAAEPSRVEATTQPSWITSIFAPWLDALRSSGPPMSSLARASEAGGTASEDPVTGPGGGSSTSNPDHDIGTFSLQDPTDSDEPYLATTTEPGGDPDPKEEEQITDDD